MKLRLLFCALAISLGLLDARGAEAPPPASDGPQRPVQDDLLDHLVGDWKLTGKMGARPVENRFQAAWVLNHQFLQLHFQDAFPAAAGHVPYEALVYVGYDNASDRYVTHWLDVFGGRFSETLGYGARYGNTLKLNFEYPDGPFHNTMTWNPESQGWHIHLQQKNAAGDWEDFAVEDLQKLTK